MEKKKIIEGKIIIPDNTTVTVDKNVVTVKGEKGEIKRDMINPAVVISLEDKNLMFRSTKSTKREKKIIDRSKYGPIGGYNWSPDGN